MENRTDEIKKDSLVRKIIFGGGETLNAIKISYVAGLGFGGLGRIPHAGILEWVPTIPPALDLMRVEEISGQRAGCYLAYSLGIATVYVDKIYPFVKEVVGKLSS